MSVRRWSSRVASGTRVRGGQWRINCTTENKVNGVDAKSNGTDVKEANDTTKKGANRDANGGEKDGRTHGPHLIYAHWKEDELGLRM